MSSFDHTIRLFSGGRMGESACCSTARCRRLGHYVASYRCRRLGRVVRRDLVLCEAHGEAFARNHGLELPARIKLSVAEISLTLKGDI